MLCAQLLREPAVSTVVEWLAAVQADFDTFRHYLLVGLADSPCGRSSYRGKPVGKTAPS